MRTHQLLLTFVCIISGVVISLISVCVFFCIFDHYRYEYDCLVRVSVSASTKLCDTNKHKSEVNIYIAFANGIFHTVKQILNGKLFNSLSKIYIYKLKFSANDIVDCVFNTKFNLFCGL